MTKGVVNGTRMIVTWVDPGLKRIRAKLLSESGTRPREVLITLHRCTIQSGAFTQERTQLPIRLAYALTINKAQGLTLTRVGLFLDKDVFAHGQMCVGMSRVGGRGPPKRARMAKPLKNERATLRVYIRVHLASFERRGGRRGRGRRRSVRRAG